MEMFRPGLMRWRVALAVIAVSVVALTGSIAYADGPGTLKLAAPTNVSITIDGQMADWASIPGVQVPLVAIPAEFRDEPTNPEPKTATLKVATDATNIYVLVTVPDGFDYDPDNHHRSPALGVEWLVDTGASPHMGAADPDFVQPTGLVDIWHWELDCGPGEISGGSFPTGNDPACNLDDEYATLTDEREDDDAENSLTGSWDHTARASGIGADGTFIFEMARPLQTGDPQDAQFIRGLGSFVTLAYWDGNEGREKDGGWSDAGHVTSADEGWITVVLQAPATTTTAPAPTAPAPPATGIDGLAAERSAAPWMAPGLAAMALGGLFAARVATGRSRR